MKRFIMLLGMTFLFFSLSGQKSYQLSGRIVDEKNHPLAGASVLVMPTLKGAIANSEGNFLIDDLNKGSYTIEISFVGYKTIVDTIDIPYPTAFEVQMNFSPIHLQEVLVCDHSLEDRKKEESMNIEIVNEQYIKQNLGGSLMNSLERLPGVSTIDIGSGQSKPVIRGMGFNRVVVVENGLKHEGQQWGSDHGLEIDQYAAEGIEIIKGPASLMYGSDAIGGVINIQGDKTPPENSFKGSVDMTGKTNNNLLGTSISLSGRKKSLYMNMRVTLLDYGDYKVPTDSIDIYSYKAALHNNQLRNTAGSEKDIHFTIGIIKERFESKMIVSNVNSLGGLFANAHGLEPRNVDEKLHDKSSRDIQYPRQQVNHLKIINRNTWDFEKIKLEADLGFQHNYRQEWSQYVSHGYMPALFPDSLSFPADLERAFEKYIYSVNLKSTYHVSENTSISSGINGDYQNNRIDGRGFIIPAFTQICFGGYSLAKHHFSQQSIVQFGFRYDYGFLQTSSYSDWFTSPNHVDSSYRYLERSPALSKSYSNYSWSIGYNYNLEKVLLKVNIGKSFRMPIAKELAANGVNYHHFSYEVGNPNLLPEISYQMDAGIEYSIKKLIIGATPFLNYFSNYIYLNPTANHDRFYGNGNQIFYYSQTNVLRYGGEIHAHYHIYKSLMLGMIGEYVYSEQLSGDKKGFTLPFSPPASILWNMKYLVSNIKFMENAYVSIDYRITASQTNIVPPEKVTPAYQLINMAMGGDINIQKRTLTISLQVQNLFNTKYYNHTSYYRLINVPDPGRNIVLNINIPF